MRNRLQRALSSSKNEKNDGFEGDGGGGGEKNVGTLSREGAFEDDDDDDDLQKVKQQKSLTGGSPKRNRGPKKMVRKTIEKTKSVARKRITGDPNYRIRDFLKVPKTIKTVDKVAFFSGVFGLLTTEGGGGEVSGKVLGVLLLRDADLTVNEDGVLRATQVAILYDGFLLLFARGDDVLSFVRLREREIVPNYFYVFEWTDIDCDSDLEKFARVSLVG